MDAIGLPGTGLVDKSIHPAWKDPDLLIHRFSGIALTVRLVPIQWTKQAGPKENLYQWRKRVSGANYKGKRYPSEAWIKIIRPGNVIVIDDVEEVDVGTIGSNNIMNWAARGAIGVVTDASARDTDEIAKERIPLYLRHMGRGIRPGRNRLESVNRPVSIGGYLSVRVM